jgi:hypothetical protein
MIRSNRRTEGESRWLKVLGTLNEYQARLFVADKALDQGARGNYPLIGVDWDVAHDDHQGCSGFGQ